jgi:hypothetical protein
MRNPLIIRTDMQHKRLYTALVVVAALLGAAPAAFGGKLYKWVDANGKVHYSDKIPPDAAAHEREIKSESGSTLGRVEAAKTKEQLEAERLAREQEEARRRAEEESARKQAAADRTLLLTFSSAADIERFRDDRVSAIDGQIRLTRERLEKLQANLEQTRRQAADAERTGRGKPAELHARVGDIERQIDDYNVFIAERQKERAAIISKFDADLARYKELTAQKAN